MKQAFLILSALLISFYAQAQDDYNGQQYEGTYQQQNSNPPPRYKHQQQSRQGWQRSRYNYFKASMGFASIDDYSDQAGDINFDSSSVLPINLAYGMAAGNISFEAELGFSFYNYQYNPAMSSPDPFFDGDLGASKLMFSGVFKTSQTGSNFYVGGGLGLVSVSIDGLEDELSGSSLATQFILGGEIRTNERSGIFIEYKQLQSVGLDLENDFTRLDFDFSESSFNLGVKFYF